MRLFLKRLLPQGLLGRSLTILVTPLLLVQLISAFVFYNNHWENMTKRLAQGIAGDIRSVMDLMAAFPGPDQRTRIIGIASTEMDLVLVFRDRNSLPPVRTPPLLRPLDTILYQAMAPRLQHPFEVNTYSERRYGIVRVFLEDDRVLEVIFPKKRLYSFTASLFLTWMCGATLLMMGVGVVFMRNQVRAVLRLAAAADRFGKGLDVGDFKVEGATEVRQAAQAFNVMRQRLGRQLQQRTQMLAGVSHDLRTPLTRMKLQLAMMEGQDGVEDLAMDMAEMERMIEGYLAFARGEGSEKPISDDLAELLGEVVSGFFRQGTPITLTLPAAVPMVIRPNVMRRALGNLIGNAARYGTNVAVSLTTSPRQATILIDDDGPGIPAHMREEVFKPFRRIEESRNQETGGVGLGLSIARDVILGHGGDIALTDSPMGGLRVIVLLPL